MLITLKRTPLFLGNLTHPLIHVTLQWLLTILEKLRLGGQLLNGYKNVDTIIFSKLRLIEEVGTGETAE